MSSFARYPSVDTTDPMVAEQLKAHPTLKPYDGKTSRHALAAKNARILLKRAYPHVTFGIRSETYSMGSSLNVSWDLMPDAPSSDEVNTLIKVFQYGEYDGMDDGYNYDRDPQRRAFRDTFGSVKTAHAQGRVLTPEDIVAIETKALQAAMDDPKAKLVKPGTHASRQRL